MLDAEIEMFRIRQKTLLHEVNENKKNLTKLTGQKVYNEETVTMQIANLDTKIRQMKKKIKEQKSEQFMRTKAIVRLED